MRYPSPWNPFKAVYTLHPGRPVPHRVGFFQWIRPMVTELLLGRNGRRPELPRLLMDKANPPVFQRQ
ncbi:hypothetical protein LSAT2_008514 [Lamellibrachia satsuma]|nr:hypothetical protein LSAT2_008514 [Lamellibrachia satsuma]